MVSDHGQAAARCLRRSDTAEAAVAGTVRVGADGRAKRGGSEGSNPLSLPRLCYAAAGHAVPPAPLPVLGVSEPDELLGEINLMGFEVCAEDLPDYSQLSVARPGQPADRTVTKPRFRF